MLPNNWRYLRGDIYYADMEPHIGSEQGGKRPVVVLQNNIGNRHSPTLIVATVYKGNIIKNLIMDCQSYTKYRPNETTGGIFVSWRRKEELPTGA